MLILDLWGISFHAVVVFALGKNLVFKSLLARTLCVAIYLNLDGKDPTRRNKQTNKHTWPKFQGWDNKDRNFRLLSL